MFSVNRLTKSFIRPFQWLLRSSTLRLTAMLSGLFAIGMAATIFLTITLGREALLDRVDTTLASLATTITVNEVASDNSNAIIRPISAFGDLPKSFERTVKKGGGTVYLNRNYNRFDVWRVMVTKDQAGTPILIALPIEDSEDALDLLGGILWTTAGVILSIAIIIGLIVGLLAQRRLQRINKALSRLAAGDLQARSGIESSSDDLDDLAQQLDITASELERLVTQTRHLSASIAHDLRTPLARLRAQLEMLPESEKRGAALEEAGRLSQIFDTIMRVARIEASQGNDGFEAINLNELIIEVEEIFGPVVEDSNKKLIVKKTDTSSILADRQMLIQAMANLIQNAIIHGGNEITLFANGSEIGVADNGKGVEKKHYSEIIKPMVRLDSSRESEGSGLGLALVRAVADRHQAKLILCENQPQGLSVVLKFTKL